MGSTLSTEPGLLLTPEDQASNTIKRAMKFNRDRINTMMKTNRVSPELWLAHHCIYSYTDDINNCAATMSNDLHIAWISTLNYDGSMDIPKYLIKAARIIKNGRENDWTSKKIVRYMYLSFTTDELREATGIVFE